MTNKQKLPAEVHEHFRKANVLHTYVETSLGEAKEHALETGQELLAAKTTIPHGRWEDECARLFDGSLRTAQFYMAFSRDFGKLKSAGKSALLMLEGTLDGAAKAAKAAAKPKPPKPKPEDPIDVDSDPVAAQVQEAVESVVAEDSPEPDYGKCPVCAGTKWKEDNDGVSCVKCHQPYGEPAGDADEDRVTTQRQKTVKTVEAAMRAFDDMHTMRAFSEHDGMIETCKQWIKIAKGWK